MNLKIKVKDDDDKVIGRHNVKSFDEFQEIVYNYKEKFK